MRKIVFDDTQAAAAAELYEQTHSVRKTAESFGVSHVKMSAFLRERGIEVLKREDAAKYTWKNNRHPHLGLTGERSYSYGREMTPETREKMRAVWKDSADRRRSGRKKHSAGYILVYCPGHPCADNGGYVLEHRLVMEQHIGRHLKKEEYVHHINENKQDNRVENLLLTNKAEHAKIHMEMRSNNNAE